MDRKQLETLLQPFLKRCAEKGKPLGETRLVEAFPGDATTSFILEVEASWISKTSASEAIDFLFDVLWDTTEEIIRRSIFSIKVMDTKSKYQLNPSSYVYVMGA